MNEIKSAPPAALAAMAVAPRARKSNYPEPFASRMGRREKRQLGDAFGLRNFGVNLTRLLPGGESALLHRHSVQDEFIYVLEGEPTLVTDAGETKLAPGMCAGFPAKGAAHQLVNRTESIAHLGSSNIDNEECWLISQSVRAMGLVYIDHQARV